MSDVQKKREAFVDAFARGMKEWWGEGANPPKDVKLATDALLAALEAEPKPGRSVEAGCPECAKWDERFLLVLTNKQKYMDAMLAERAAHDALKARVERAIEILGPRLHGQGPTHDCAICRAIRILEGREP